MLQRKEEIRKKQYGVFGQSLVRKFEGEERGKNKNSWGTGKKKTSNWEKKKKKRSTHQKPKTTDKPPPGGNLGGAQGGYGGENSWKLYRGERGVRKMRGDGRC